MTELSGDQFAGGEAWRASPQKIENMKTRFLPKPELNQDEEDPFHNPKELERTRRKVGEKDAMTQLVYEEGIKEGKERAKALHYRSLPPKPRTPPQPKPPKPQNSYQVAKRRAAKLKSLARKARGR